MRSFAKNGPFGPILTLEHRLLPAIVSLSGIRGGYGLSKEQALIRCVVLGKERAQILKKKLPEPVIISV